MIVRFRGRSKLYIISINDINLITVIHVIESLSRIKLMTKNLPFKKKFKETKRFIETSNFKLETFLRFTTILHTSDIPEDSVIKWGEV